MYDAKGIILKQNKNCRWHMTTIKLYSNISRFKSIFAKVSSVSVRSQQSFIVGFDLTDIDCMIQHVTAL